MVDMSLDIYLEEVRPVAVFDSNYTHNVVPMAKEAGIYQQVWHPESLGITHAEQLIAPLRTSIVLLKSDPERFKGFDPKNGWGGYETFVPWLERLLEACEAHPGATVRTST